MPVFQCLVIWGFLCLLNDKQQSFVSAAVQRDCASGTYYSNGRCIACKPGTASRLPGQTVCDPCPTGHYQGESGQTSCKPCAVGFFADTTGRHWCPACWDGVIQPYIGADRCISCERGTYTTGWGQAFCARCPFGKTTARLGSSSIDDCNTDIVNDCTRSDACNNKGRCYTTHGSKISGCDCNFGFGGFDCGITGYRCHNKNPCLNLNKWGKQPVFYFNSYLYSYRLECRKSRYGYSCYDIRT